MLPDDVLEAVFEHLAVRDLLRAMRVCKSWNAVIRQSHLWRRLGKKHFLLADGTYADFQRMGSEFGKYLDIYARVVRAWDAIKSVEGRNGIRFTLLPGATEAALDRVEKVMGFEYPKDLRCSLRVVGGQPFVDPRTGVSPALGAVFFYENVLDYLLPINEHRDEQGLISVVGHDSEIGVAWSAVADSLTGRQFPKGTVFSMPDVHSIGDPLMFLAPSWLDYLESRAKVAASPNLKFVRALSLPGRESAKQLLCAHRKCIIEFPFTCRMRGTTSMAALLSPMVFALKLPWRWREATWAGWLNRRR